MDFESFYRLGNNILKVPYLLGLPSVRLNKTTQTFEPISYILDKFRCLFISSVMFFLKCLLVIVVIADQRNLNLARFEDGMHMTLASICLASLGVDLHFWRKFDNNLRLLNVQRVTFHVVFSKRTIYHFKCYRDK